MVNTKQTSDYIYCEDCKEYADLLRYGTFEQNQYRAEQTEHINHNWRYITDSELKEEAYLPIYIRLNRYEITLLERGMRLLRYNSLDTFNEDKKYIPVADNIILKLQIALE
jgi:hypothetical protein